MLSITGLFVLFILVGAFLSALFINDKRKMFFALAFDAIGFVTLALLFSNGDFWLDIGGLIVAAMAMLMLLLDKKYVPVVAWIVTGLILLMSLLFSIHRMIGRYGFSTVYGEDSQVYVIFDFTAIIIWVADLAFMIAASVIRAKRHKKEKKSEQTENIQLSDGYYRREGRDGCAVAANILAPISYISGLLGIRAFFSCFGFFGLYIGDMFPFFDYFFNDTAAIIIFFSIMLVCGVAAWYLYRASMEYGYVGNVLESALYVWTWIPTIVFAIVCFIISLIGGASEEGNASSKFNKKVYKIRDENGREHTLNYKEGETYCTDEEGTEWTTDDGGKSFYKKQYSVIDEHGYEHVLDYKHGEKTAKDILGNVWATDDEGKTFYERDVRYIENDDGTKTRVRDVSDGRGHLYENYEGLYESEGGGKTVTKIDKDN